MPSETVIALRKQLREKFPAAHRSCGGPPQPARRSLGEGGAVAAAICSSNPASSITGSTEPPSFDISSKTSPPRHEATQAPTSHFPLGTRHFPSGSITEISPAEPSCGLSLIIAALLTEENPSGQTETPKHPPVRRNFNEGGNTEVPLVLIDARDRFDPASFTPEECNRLLWLRCRDTTQALRAADLLLRDGNLPFVLLDLSALPARELRRIPNSSWHRLRQLAETTNTTLLALTPTPLIPRTSLRLTLTRQFTIQHLHLSRRELLASIQTQTTRHLHHTRTA